MLSLYARTYADRAGGGTNGGPGRVEQQAPVGTVHVVALDELGEHRPEVLLINGDQVVEALVREGPDASLRNRIGAGRPHWTEQGLDAQAPGPPRGPGQNGKLLAEEQVLGGQVGVAAQQRAEQADKEDQLLEHHSEGISSSASQVPGRSFSPLQADEDSPATRPPALGDLVGTVLLESPPRGLIDRKSIPVDGLPTGPGSLVLSRR